MAGYTNTRGFVLAAAMSGAGKTTVASAICSALSKNGYVVQPFKTGPDFVDPTYLTLAAGRRCRNLDGYPNPSLMSYFYAEGTRAKPGSPAADIAVIEGVMGMYDGLGPGGLYSTAWLARELSLPVVLLVDAKAAATSVAALVKGFATLEPLAPEIVGVIANRVAGAAHAELIGEALDRFAGIPLIGWLPNVRDAQFPSRHLGLIPAPERKHTELTLERFTEAVREHVDLNRLAGMAKLPHGRFVSADLPDRRYSRADGSHIRVAVADDDAFCFHYRENWDLLDHFGVEMIRTSPLNDAVMPGDIDLLLLPGGYPEEFAVQLSQNERYIESVRKFSMRGGAIYAECGGMLYLTRGIRYHDEWNDLAGLIDAETHMTDRLQHFGYVEASALGDNLLLRKGESLRAHEFHYSRVEGIGAGAFRVRKASRPQDEWIDGYSYAGRKMLASYLHVNFYSCSAALGRMLEQFSIERSQS